MNVSDDDVTFDVDWIWMSSYMIVNFNEIVMVDEWAIEVTRIWSYVLELYIVVSHSDDSAVIVVSVSWCHLLDSYFLFSIIFINSYV